MSTGQAVRPTATVVTADGTLAKGKHNPVDATSGTRTMTLPTGVTIGAIVSVEKTDASVNPVIVSGTIRGASSTITLYDTNETRDFVAESSSSWRPLADHRPRAALRGRRVNEVYDEFSRYADGTLSGKVPIVGAAWVTSGANPTVVSSGKATSSGTGYMGQTLARKVTSIGCELIWSGSGTTSAMTLIASSDASITLQNAVHFNFGPTGFLLTLRKDANPVTLLSGAWSTKMAVDATTVYRVGMLIKGNTVTVVGPNGEKLTASDASVGALNGTLAVWEPNSSTTVANLTSVIAGTEAPTGQMSPADVAAFDAGGGFLHGPSKQVVGNRNTMYEVMVGIDGTTNMPAITFGAQFVITTLTTAIAIGDTTVLTADSIPNGSTLQIGNGTTGEALTSNTNPTGSGPYSHGVSSAATKVHSVGDSVLAAVPTSKRTVAYFNVQSGVFYLPPVNTVVQGSNLYFGTALDVQLARLATGVVGVGSSQMIRTGIGATGSRPAASSGAGAQWFDSSIGVPIWSTGSQWADGSGYINQLITRTTNNSIGLGDKVTVFNGTSLTATLADPTTVVVGRVFTIKNINSSALTVASAGTSKTIDGAASASLAQWVAGRYVSDGTQWLSV